MNIFPGHSMPQSSLTHSHARQFCQLYHLIGSRTPPAHTTGMAHTTRSLSLDHGLSLQTVLTITTSTSSALVLEGFNLSLKGGVLRVQLLDLQIARGQTNQVRRAIASVQGGWAVSVASGCNGSVRAETRLGMNEGPDKGLGE